MTALAMPPVELPSARNAYHQYCSTLLTVILRSTELLSADGEKLFPTGYFLRCRDRQTAADYGIGEVIPLLRSGSADASPLTATIDALLEITVPENQYIPLFEAAWTSKSGSEAGDWDCSPEASGDYAFSYSVPPAQASADDLDYLASLLATLLDEADLVQDDKVVYPAALRRAGATRSIPLRALAEPHASAERTENTKSKIRRQPLFSVSQTEPTIPVLARHWSLVIDLVDVEAKGQAVSVEGFRLRRTADWVVPSHGHPSEVYEHLARVCNVACTFCYLFGNPETLAIARAKKSIARDELDTRLHYYQPDKKRALFAAQWELNEFLVDPRLPDVMRDVRQRTDRAFFFTTNGNPLTPRIVEQLAELKPVHFVVSTNTVDEPLRQEVMKEKAARTWTALHCLQELRQHEIPFGVSLVATPDFPLEDLTKTIETVSGLDPAFIRVNEPGFTRDHPFKMDFDTDVLWGSVIEWLHEIRDQTNVPIVAIPSAFEENFFYDDPLAPRIIGTVPGSPAASSDLRPGDVIEKLGFLTPKSRSELASALLLMRGKVKLKVRRGGSLLDLELDTTIPWRYPFTGPVIGKYFVPHGIVTAPSISVSDATGIANAIDDTGARNSWLVTSSLMLPAAKVFVERYLPDHADRVEFVVATNDYLGGNIRVLDMCTVGDIHSALVRHVEETRKKPDLILLPATGFNPHGRDLIGRHWGDLERSWNIPVRLLGHTTQFVF